MEVIITHTPPKRCEIKRSLLGYDVRNVLQGCLIGQKKCKYCANCENNIYTITKQLMTDEVRKDERICRLRKQQIM